jgi:hypothetical protein
VREFRVYWIQSEPGKDSQSSHKLWPGNSQQK